MRFFRSDEVDIPYEDYKKLYMEGKCKLGITNAAAASISRTKGALPKGSGIRFAFAFYNFIAFGCMGYSIYLSFTWNWWTFIAGFFIASFVFNVNKKSNAENLVNEAHNNKEFYEQIRFLKTVSYQLDEIVAENYKK